MSHRRILLFPLAGIGLTVAVLQAVAVEFYLYWNFVWFDVLMHLLGGAFVAFLALWFFAALADRGVPLADYPLQRESAGLLTVVVAALAVGIAWEFFELATGLLVEDNYAFDTSLDLLMDTLGALGAVGAVSRSLYQRKDTLAQ